MDISSPRAVHCCAKLKSCRCGCLCRAPRRVLTCSASLKSTETRLQTHEALQPARLAVFASGRGSNLKAISRAAEAEQFPATVEVIVSDNPSCGACHFAAEKGIPKLIYPVRGATSGLQTEHCNSPAALTTALQEKSIDYVILAGYMKLIPEELIESFPRAILNIHPALLPAFGGKGLYGKRVHKAVIASGARFTGPTVHFVDAEYDTGPILAQRVICVNPLETHEQLAARVLKEEHIIYPEAIAALVEHRVSWRDDGIPVIWNPS